jgi:hypothetical protein
MQSLRWWAGALMGGALLALTGGRMSRRDEAVKRAEMLARFCSAALDPKPFVLVLRSFTSVLLSEKIERSKLVDHEWETPRGYFRQGKQIETTGLFEDDIFQFLVRYTTGYHLVVINSDASALSPRPLTVISGEQWHKVFLRLADRAAGIVVVPGATTSVTAEINTVVTKHLRHALFVMPPTLRSDFDKPDGIRNHHGQMRPSAWNELVDKVPITLPPYAPAGAFFQFASADRRPNRFEYSESGLESALESICNKASTTSGAFANLYDAGLLSETIGAMEQQAASIAPFAKRQRLTATGA